MNARFCFIYLVIILAVGTNSFAQENYIVGPKDVIKIEVAKEPDLTAELPISENGTIAYWVIGEIPVSGLKVSEIKDKLTQILGEKYIKNPIVSVRVTKFGSKEVIINGAVRNPGSYILESNSVSFLKLISMAGGLNPDCGSQAYVLRPLPSKPSEPSSSSGSAESSSTKNPPEGSTKQKITINLAKLLNEGDVSQDIEIFGGDFVLIPTKNLEDLSKNYVFVEGAVTDPGRIEYQPGLTALKACIQAGGFTEMASPNKAKIIRQGKDGKTIIIKAKLKDIRNGKKPDIPLEPGDRITVPEGVI